MGNHHTPDCVHDYDYSASVQANRTMSSITAISTRNDWRSTTTQSPYALAAHIPQSPQCNTRLEEHVYQPTYSSLSIKSKKIRRRSSLLSVKNGITGKYISSRICKIAARFWKDNVEKLPHAEQLEISCSIFFGMMSSDHEMAVFLKSKLKLNDSIKNTTSKYLDMMGWLIRHLVTDKIDLYVLLDKLGAFHRQIGIKIDHFVPMLESMHDSFAYYFKNKYNIEVKYAMDEIFSFTAQLMTGQNINCCKGLRDINKAFESADIPFLENLSTCLKSQIGRSYIYRYLSQCWCDELVIFLQSLQRFKQLMSDKERFFVAREITKHSINPIATFALNLSYDARANALHAMTELEALHDIGEKFEVSANLYDEIEKVVINLIMDNHWCKFVENIKRLQSKSFDIKYLQ